jgi:hypothetical protein
MKAISPTGTTIVGTVETIPGTANIEETSFLLDINGVLCFEYSGGTDVDWDEQETVTVNGKRQFVDEGGDVWGEDKIKLVENDKEDEEEKLPFTVLLMLPDQLRTQEMVASDWIKRIFVEATYSEAAIGVAQVVAAEDDGENDIEAPRPELYRPVAVYSGHVFDHHQLARPRN